MTVMCGRVKSPQLLMATTPTQAVTSLSSTHLGMTQHLHHVHHWLWQWRGEEWMVLISRPEMISWPVVLGPGWDLWLTHLLFRSVIRYLVTPDLGLLLTSQDVTLAALSPCRCPLGKRAPYWSSNTTSSNNWCHMYQVSQRRSADLG